MASVWVEQESYCLVEILCTTWSQNSDCYTYLRVVVLAQQFLETMAHFLNQLIVLIGS